MGFRSAEVINVLRQVIKGLGDSISVGQLIHDAVQTAFRRGTIVARDIDDQRIIQLTSILDGVDNAADLIVRMFNCAAENFHPAGANLLVRVT